MSARDTLIGLLEQWARQAGAAEETPEAVADAYAVEIRQGGAATVRAAKLREPFGYGDGRVNRILERVAKKIEKGAT
jgi:hypothetical protein